MTDKPTNSITRENKRLHIGFLVETLDKQCLELKAVQQILEKIEDHKFMLNFTYAFYTDYNLMPEQILLPVFHTYYLNTDKKNIVLLDDKLLNVCNIYDYHSYYSFDKNDEMPDNVKLIESLQEIIDEELQESN